MAKNKIEDLRNHLFETLEALKDKDEPMDLGRARAIADVARVIVDTSKVEVDFLKVTGALRSTDFLPSGEEEENTRRPKPKSHRGRKRMNDALCIGCECTDSQACPGGCSWLYVDYDAGYGICSSCPEVYEDFEKRVEVVLEESG